MELLDQAQRNDAGFHRHLGRHQTVDDLHQSQTPRKVGDDRQVIDSGR